jgi:hypothetical protein
MKFLKLSCFLVCLSLFFGVYSFAGNDNGKWVEPGLFLDNFIGFTWNGASAGLITHLYYRIPVVKDTDMLWNSTKMEIGIRNLFSPSIETISAYFKIVPIAVFELEILAGYEYMFAGLTGGLYPLGNLQVDYTMESRRVKTPNPDSVGGSRIEIKPTLQMAVGNVALQSSLTTGFLSFPNPYSEYFYDHYTDAVYENNDIYFISDTKLVYMWDNLLAGVGYRLLWVNSSRYVIDALTAVSLYTPKWQGLPNHIEPYAAFQIGTHFRDRYFKHTLHIGGMIGVGIKLL